MSKESLISRLLASLSYCGGYSFFVVGLLYFYMSFHAETCPCCIIGFACYFVLLVLGSILTGVAIAGLILFFIKRCFFMGVRERDRKFILFHARCSLTGHALILGLLIIFSFMAGFFYPFLVFLPVSIGLYFLGSLILSLDAFCKK